MVGCSCTCARVHPLFRISRTAGRTALKLGVWLGDYLLCVLLRVGCPHERTCNCACFAYLFAPARPSPKRRLTGVDIPHDGAFPAMFPSRSVGVLTPLSAVAGCLSVSFIRCDLFTAPVQWVVSISALVAIHRRCLNTASSVSAGAGAGACAGATARAGAVAGAISPPALRDPSGMPVI